MALTPGGPLLSWTGQRDGEFSRHHPVSTQRPEIFLVLHRTSKRIHFDFVVMGYHVYYVLFMKIYIYLQ